MMIRHTATYLVAKLAPGVLGMLTTSFLTRLLIPADYGLYGLALVIANFASIMLFDWLLTSFLRFYEGRSADLRTLGTFVHLFLAVVLLSLVALVAAWATGLVSNAMLPVFIAGTALAWCFAWFELAAQFEVVRFESYRYLRMNSLRALLILAGAVGAAWLTHDPIATAFGTALGAAGGALSGRLHGARLGRAYFDGTLARQVLAFGVPMAIGVTIASLALTGTRALVERLDSLAGLGHYTAAYMLTQNTLVMVGTGVNQIGYPLAVRALESGDAEAVRRQLTRTITLLMALTGPAALGLALTADGVSQVLVGLDFVHSVAMLMPWMALAAFLHIMRSYYLDHAFALGQRPSQQIAVTTVLAVVTLSLCFVLIPRIGLVGAAIAVVIGLAVSCVHATIAGRFVFPMPLPVPAALRVAAACAVMAAAVRATPGSGLTGLSAQIGVGIVTYSVAALVLNILDARDLVREHLGQRIRHLVFR